MSEKKPKILLFAFHTITVLDQYIKYLQTEADCCWATFRPNIQREIIRAGYDNVYFDNMIFPNIKPELMGKISRRINAWHMTLTLEKRIDRMIRSVRPDIIVSNTTRILPRYGKKNIKGMTVQVFHSVPYKQYILVPETLYYDLVLLPNEYQKKELCRRFGEKNPDRLKIVGWPRIDDFQNDRFTQKDRNEFLISCGLDPVKKTVLFAPSHNTFHNKDLFPRSFGLRHKAFEVFCREITQRNVNLIVKLHPGSRKLIRNAQLYSIAKRYNVYFAYMDKKDYLEESTPRFLWSADVLIGNTSGIINDFIILNRPIIYIEPDAENYAWEDADLPKDYRAGIVVADLNRLIAGVERSLKNPLEFADARQKSIAQIFTERDGRSAQRAAKTVLDYYHSCYADKARSRETCLL